VGDLVARLLYNQSILRLINAVERRLGNPLELSAAQLVDTSWDEVASRISRAVQAQYERRKSIYLDPGGQIDRL